MSKEYNHETLSAESWTRAKRIVIENPLNGVSTLKFVAEKVIKVSEDTYLKQDIGVLNVTMDEDALNQEISLVNPITGESVGQTVTPAFAHMILYSAYIHFSELQNNPPSVEEEEEDIVEEDPPMELI